MNRKQLQLFGERYGVFIKVNQLTDENMVKIDRDIQRFLKKWKMVADANLARAARPKQHKIDWDIS